MALYSSPDYQTSFKSTGLLVQKKFNIDFQDGGHGAILDFQSEHFLVIFYLKVTSILSLKFCINWLFN